MLQWLSLRGNDFTGMGLIEIVHNMCCAQPPCLPWRKVRRLAWFWSATTRLKWYMSQKVEVWANFSWPWLRLNWESTLSFFGWGLQVSSLWKVAVKLIGQPAQHAVSAHGQPKMWGMGGCGHSGSQRICCANDGLATFDHVIRMRTGGWTDFATIPTR